MKEIIEAMETFNSNLQNSRRLVKKLERDRCDSIPPKFGLDYLSSLLAVLNDLACPLTPSSQYGRCQSLNALGTLETPPSLHGSAHWFLPHSLSLSSHVSVNVKCNQANL
jgi:hypothetical protein